MCMYSAMNYSETSVDLLSVDLFNMTTNDTGNSTTQDIATPQDNHMYQLSIHLLQWTLPIIVVLGTVGNTFNFILMLQREMRQTSTFFYLAVLAVADTAVLLLSAMKTWIRSMSGFELLHMSNASCKLLTFLTYFSLHYSAWLIVAVTVERFLVVWFPLKASSICSTMRAKLSTLAIGTVLFVVNAHLFWTAELIKDPISGQKCAMLQNHKILYKNVLPGLHLTIYCLLPCLFLLIFNLLIIISLVRHRQEIIATTMTKDDRRSRYKHRKLAVTLLCISFVWIITTMPSALYTLLDTEPGAKQLLIKVICYIFLYINHSINFLLFCVTGKNFRQEFRKLVCRHCHRRKKPKPRLTFRASHSGSGSIETTFLPLMDNMYVNSRSKATRSRSS